MEYRFLRYRITKKGRKWFEGEVPDRGWKARIEINDVSRDWEVGAIVEFYGKVEIERSRYGTKVKVYPVPNEVVMEARRKDLEREYSELRERIESARDEGWYPDRLADKLLAVAEKLGRVEEAQEFIRQVREEAEHKKAWKNYRKTMEKILSLREGDRLSYMDELLSRVTKLAERYRDIAEDLGNRMDRIMEIEQLLKLGEAKRRMERVLIKMERYIRSSLGVPGELIDEFNKLVPVLRDLGAEDFLINSYRRLEELEKLQNKLVNETISKINSSTLEVLRRHFSDAEIFRLVRDGKIDPDVEYVPVSDWQQKFWWRIAKKHLGGIVLAKSTPEGKNYIALVPAENYELAMRLKEELRPERIHELLRTIPVESEAISDEKMEDVLPKQWNHLKGQFVAVLTPELKMEYISRCVDYTRSGANARLETDLPTEAGTLLLTYDGSHRHMYLNLYRRDEDGWRLIHSVHNGTLNDLLMEVLEERAKQLLEREDVEVEM